MGRIELESFGLSCPDFTDVFVGRETFEGLQPTGEVAVHPWTVHHEMANVMILIPESRSDVAKS